MTAARLIPLLRIMPEATKRRRDEWMARIAANPRCKIVTGTGRGFIIGMPGGMRKQTAKD